MSRSAGALGHPAVAVLASSVVAQLALLVSGPLVVRLLGVPGRGELALAWSLVLGTSQVAMLGLPSAVTWFAASRGIEPARIVTTVLRGYLAQVAVTAGAVAVVVALLTGGGWGRALVALAGVVALMLAVLGLAALQGAGRFGAFALLQAFPAVSYAAAVVLLFARGSASVTLLLALSLAGWAVVAVVSLALVRALRATGPRGEVPTAGEARAYGRRAMIAGLAPIDTLGLEQVLVGLVASHYVLGLFVVGWAFETGPVLVLAALAAFVGPRLSALSLGRGEFVRRWLLISVALGVGVCATIQVVLEPVLVWAFGTAAAPAVDLARVLTVAGVLLGLRRVTAACLVGLGRPGEATGAELVGLATMVVGMLPMAVGTSLVHPGWVLVAAGAVTLLGQTLLLLRALTPSALASA